MSLSISISPKFMSFFGVTSIVTGKSFTYRSAV